MDESRVPKPFSQPDSFTRDRELSNRAATFCTAVYARFLPITSFSSLARRSPLRFNSLPLWLKSQIVNTLERMSCPRSPSILRMSHFAWLVSLHATRESANLYAISLGAPFSPCQRYALGASRATTSRNRSTFA